MKGKVLHHLLEAGSPVFITGIGNFSVEQQSAEIQPGSSQIFAPSKVINFSPKPVKTQLALRDRLEQVYGLSSENAAHLESSFSAEIAAALAGDRRFVLPDLGMLLADVDGNIQFVPERNRFSSGDFFGLRPLAARPMLIRRETQPEKEAPVIPLLPFEESKNRARKPFRSMAYAAVGAGLAIAAGSLIWLNSLHTESGQQAAILPSAGKPVAVTALSAEKPAISGQATNPIQSAAATSFVQESKQFFVVAGSFRNPGVAESADALWRKEGYQTSLHEAKEKQMTRVSIGSFDSKEKAIEFMEKARPEFSSSLWILAE